MLNRNRTASHYKPCGKCGGMYSTLSLSSHYRRCELNRLKGSKDVLKNSKKKSILATIACSVLRNEILPVLRDDEITKAIVSDDLTIAFGNRMCQKYRSPHLYKMIRARLRCVAKLFLILKKKTHVYKFEQFFDSEYYDCIISAINEMCQLNEETGKYKSASTAFAIGSYLKKISFYLLSELIKNKNKEKQNDVKYFLQLLQEGLQHDVYKTVEENQQEQKRRKIIELPSSDDILLLRNYLNRKRNFYMQCLKKEYSYNNWKRLMSVILISLQLFNRRRAGEMERVKIEDYLKYERLKDDNEMLGCMSAEEKKRKKGYIRFLIRGKRCRGGNRENFEGIQMISKFRKQTNISERNPYLFGLPGKDDFNHLLATRLLNQYSKLCGAKKPHTLRGIELRKHIATKCGTMNLGDVELKDVADYLGHNEKIHLDHYRLPSATKDIVRMSNILECAQGSINESLDEIGERYSISENSCNGIFEESKNEDNFNNPTSGKFIRYISYVLYFSFSLYRRHAKESQKNILD
ncbi:uncharacterized protein LOC130897580 [Diorhabda carinulata]|uniref:uncharacterized protein LOC130897580 n=1 Tax=Diorhabda carinulata TaxID=1163345 RepID=UPI0025A26836|nr:uncharacterized protein LOC130897580 [Diorhabda carinulata]